MANKEDLEDALHSIVGVDFCLEAIESLSRPVLDSLARDILNSNISKKESQEKLILDKARYEGARQALDSILTSLEKVKRNG